MAPRANWKGYLKLSLVSCAVALYPATTTSERIRLHILNRDTGNRIKNQRVDAETGDVVESEDQVKGYKVGGNRYVYLEEDELDQVALESTHTIEIEAFVPRSEIDEIYLDESYYIAPDDEVAQEPFAVIRAAMDKKDMVGLARIVLHRREKLLMLEPRGKGLQATVLRYRNEVRDEAPYFEDIKEIKIPHDMLDLAVHIVDSKKAHFDPTKFEDRYEDALNALIKAKQAGKEPPEPPKSEPSNVINLMDALRRSVKAERGGSSRSSARGARKRPAKASARKRAAPKKRLKKAS